MSKLPCYQMCARNSIVTVYISKKHTEVKEKRGPKFLESHSWQNVLKTNMGGEAIFTRDDLKVKSISVTAANHVEVITAELPDVVVHSVYKPPSEQFVLPPLGHRSLP